MARRNSSTGKFVVSAGEVGQFVYCPESWRLRHQSTNQDIMTRDERRSREFGQIMHSKWSSELDAAAHLSEGLRFLVALLITTLVIVIAY